MPTSPRARPKNRLARPRGQRGAQHGRDGGQRQDHQREVLGRAEQQRHLDHQRRDEGQRRRGDRAGDERADRGGSERLGAAAFTRHLVTVDGGHDAAGLARRVEQDRRGRAAVHRAVVDAGEHDEGGSRFQIIGDRQQEGHGEGRADAGQHAHRRADGHPQGRPEQVERRERHGEAVGECGECFHGSAEPFHRARRAAARPSVSVPSGMCPVLIRWFPARPARSCRRPRRRAG